MVPNKALCRNVIIFKDTLNNQVRGPAILLAQYNNSSNRLARIQDVESRQIFWERMVIYFIAEGYLLTLIAEGYLLARDPIMVTLTNIEKSIYSPLQAIFTLTLLSA